MPEIYRNKKLFDYYKCEKTNCEFVDDKSKLKDSNAIVFDYYNQLNSTKLPKLRRKMQLYIFYAEEAPIQIDESSELNELKIQFKLVIHTRFIHTTEKRKFDF